MRDPQSLSRLRVLLQAALGLALAVLWAAPALAQNEPRPLVLQLRWDHQFQFAGYYAAQWQGYYDQAGLDVEIRSAMGPGDQVVSAVDEVASGRADFGVGAADVLLARDRGVPLVVIASIFQRSASAWYAVKPTPLHTAGDLIGKRVMRRPNDLIDVELQAVLQAEGIDLDQIQTVTDGADDPWITLTQGHADVVQAYTIAGPFEATRRGLDLHELRPHAYSVDFYGDSLFTHQRLIDQDPDVVERFRAASLRGWQWAMQHPEQMIEQIVAHYPQVAKERGRDFNRFQADAVREVMLYPTVEPGHINPHRWAQMHEVLSDLGLIAGPLQLDRLIYDNRDMAAQQMARRRRQLGVGLGVTLAALLLLGGVVWFVSTRRLLAARTAVLRRRTAKLEAVIQQIGDGVIIHDTEGQLRVLSPAAARFFGTDRDRLKRIFDCTRPADQGLWGHDAGQREFDIAAELRLHMAGQMPLGPIEWSLPSQAGPPLRVGRFVGLPVRSPEGEALLYVTTIQDVTEPRAAERQLRQLNATLEQRVQQRTDKLEQQATQLRRLAMQLTEAEQNERQRIAELIHNHLQQLIVAAKMRGGLMRQWLDHPELIEALDEILELLDESVEAARSLSKELHPPVLQRGDLVAALRWLAKHMGDQHGLNVELDAPESVPPVDRQTGGLIFEAMRELLFNIVKHANTDRARLDVAVRPDHSLELVVSDEGLGFEVSKLDGDDSAAGFGLFGIRQRLRLLGGSLTIESCVDQGTRAALLLPLPESQPTPPAPAPVQAAPAAAAPNAVRLDVPRRVRVLLVDDHALVREGAANLLGEHPAVEVVGQAADGDEALQLSWKLRPHVVVMDVNMPVMNGIDATAVIKRELPETRVISLTVRRDDGTEEAILSAGAERCLNKGGPPRALLEAILAAPVATPAA